MTDFVTATAGLPALDPWKRVRYSYGLVLGVDEFLQDQHYHTERNRLHNRALHGYGTVWGLALQGPQAGDADPELRVAPGLAVDARGREMHVPTVMCVKLRPWLQRWRSWLEPRFGGVAGGSIPLAVSLCYRECETDEAPVPGEPCRTAEDAVRPTRLRDSFELRLALRELPAGSPPDTPPEALALHTVHQPEEDAARALGALLGRLRLTRAGEVADDPETMVDAVRAIAPGAPEASPPLASPPEQALLLDPATADDTVRAMLRVWVTEVRPALVRAESGDPCSEPGCCLLLGEIDLPVTALWEVGPGTTIDETRRPVLLTTRVLQEWLAGGLSDDDEVGAAPGGGVTDHGTLTGLQDDDHPQYLRRAESFGGDVAGRFNTVEVRGLRGRPVAATAPANRQVLTFDGASNSWIPANVPSGGGGGSTPIPADVVRAPNVASTNPGSAVNAVTIVAAGTVQVEGDTADVPVPTYGNLKVAVIRNSNPAIVAPTVLQVGFDGYQRPNPNNPRHAYVVQLTSAAPFNQLALFTVVGFAAEGMQIVALNRGGTEEAKQYGVMISVLRYTL